MTPHEANALLALILTLATGLTGWLIIRFLREPGQRGTGRRDRASAGEADVGSGPFEPDALDDLVYDMGLGVVWDRDPPGLPGFIPDVPGPAPGGLSAGTPVLLTSGHGPGHPAGLEQPGLPVMLPAPSVTRSEWTPRYEHPYPDLSRPGAQVTETLAREPGDWLDALLDRARDGCRSNAELMAVICARAGVTP